MDINAKLELAKAIMSAATELDRRMTDDLPESKLLDAVDGAMVAAKIADPDILRLVEAIIMGDAFDAEEWAAAILEQPRMAA